MDKILLIDDEADVQYSFRRIFDGPDIELHTVSSGEEGLRQIPVLRPDLVITDIRMAGINGLETLKRIRQLDPKLPVILMTGYAWDVVPSDGLMVLSKPFSRQQLVAAIATAVAGRAGG
jgi:CheY-like chemotaxis protein